MNAINNPKELVEVKYGDRVLYLDVVDHLNKTEIDALTNEFGIQARRHSYTIRLIKKKIRGEEISDFDYTELGETENERLNKLTNFIMVFAIGTLFTFLVMVLLIVFLAYFL